MWKPEHISVAAKDIASGQPGGRFFLLPGSPARAEALATRFKNQKRFESPRGHDVFVGELEFPEGKVDVGVVSTGMGCPSLGIIVAELQSLGASRFLRVGTAGSLQPKLARAGDVVIATGAVRDEGASLALAPAEVPAIASHELVSALRAGALRAGLGDRTRLGLVHTKDSLYAREFGQGVLAPENARYLEILKGLGVLATEMEASHLFLLGTSANYLRPSLEQLPAVLTGCVLAVIGDDQPFATDAAERTRAVERACTVACEGIRALYFPA